MAQLKDITGERFGKLTATEFVGRREGRTYWRFRCDCGGSYEGRSYHVVDGRVSSCGCARTDARRARPDWHGMTDSSEHSSWTNMLTRCTNSKSQDWHLYGGRGIRVCERWQDFKDFLADMGRKPSASHSIDRIDVNGNYEPGNCRWATPKQQRANQRPAERKAA